ncbi:MAG: insulinase family protein, partial [Alistipes sp.]|nr:insulinase family protein [Alistipes sp.]
EGYKRQTELRNQLAGISASVELNADNYPTGINGVCAPKDVETMLQLLYLNFVQPRYDETDYATLTKMLRSQLENAESNPDFVMQKRFMDVAYGHNPRRQVTTAKTMDGFRFELLPIVHDKLYRNANDFTFTFVGNVDMETLKPLVEKYIGSLPTAKTKTKAIDDHSAPVKGETIGDFRTAMQQPKVSVHYLFSGQMPYTFKNRLALTFLTQALDSRYLISIREEKGGTYGVQVYGGAEYLPQESYKMHIAFDTNEEMADELLEIVMAEIEKIAAEGPLTEDIEKNREFMLKSWKNSLEQNNQWMRYIQSKYTSGADYLADYEKALRDLTNADVQAMAKKILEDGNLVKVIMRPEQAE